MCDSSHEHHNVLSYSKIRKNPPCVFSVPSGQNAFQVAKWDSFYSLLAPLFHHTVRLIYDHMWIKSQLIWFLQDADKHPGIELQVEVVGGNRGSQGIQGAPKMSPKVTAFKLSEKINKSIYFYRKCSSFSCILDWLFLHDKLWSRNSWNCNLRIVHVDFIRLSCKSLEVQIKSTFYCMTETCRVLF